MIPAHRREPRAPDPAAPLRARLFAAWLEETRGHGGLQDAQTRVRAFAALQAAFGTAMRLTAAGDTATACR